MYHKTSCIKKPLEEFNHNLALDKSWNSKMLIIIKTKIPKMYQQNTSHDNPTNNTPIPPPDVFKIVFNSVS